MKSNIKLSLVYLSKYVLMILNYNQEDIGSNIFWKVSKYELNLYIVCGKIFMLI